MAAVSNSESVTGGHVNESYRDDIDDDDDHLNQAHKVVPSHHPSSVSADSQTVQTTKESAAKQTGATADTSAHTPIFVQCRIQREKGGITKGFSTSFALHYDGAGGNDRDVPLFARKHRTIGGHIEYYIGTDAESLAKNLTDENAIAKLRGNNIANTEYILYDLRNSSAEEKTKPQMAAIVYDAPLFGGKEPRKFAVLLHDVGKSNQTLKEGETIIDAWRAKNLAGLTEMKNKAPTYHEESKTYTLNVYANRIKEASHKNFQLITADSDDGQNVVMQFGRINENEFALDYRSPLTSIQAFAIALASFQVQ